MADVRVNRSEAGPGRPRLEMGGVVLGAVIDLITESGMSAVTIDAVSARAGVSRAAIYRRWPTKHDLLVAAAETRVGVIDVPDQGAFRAELHTLLTARVQDYRAPGTSRLLAGLIGTGAEVDPAPAVYATYTRLTTEQTRRIIERGIARGDVRPEVDVDSVTTLIAASLIFRLVAELREPDAFLVDQVVDLVGRAVEVR